MVTNIVVIGAGVMGLSSGVNILENIPDVTVTIMADKFSPNTTSDGAAGIWLPFISGDTPVDLKRRWAEATFRHYEALSVTEESSKAGIITLSTFRFANEPMQEPYWSNIVYNFKHISKEKMSRLFPHARYGFFFTTFLAECSIYLPWLMRRFEGKGGKVIKRRISDLKELAGHYDVIVNCSGLQARSLVGDDCVYPTRGQLIRVKAPWIKHYVSDFVNGCHIIPCTNNVVLGGTSQEGNWSTEVDAEDRKSIYEKCCATCPSLRNATIDHDWVGLRPGRDIVRLEKEVREINGEEMKIVHNYGHGGNGITMHWGCAQDTTALVAELLGRNETSGNR